MTINIRGNTGKMAINGLSISDIGDSHCTIVKKSQTNGMKSEAEAHGSDLI